uniref:Odorant receptor n=1 Tax=Tetraodon nigroviridis TaxID=99883 RepID=Q2PR79_TETNG|nr:odorant receptor [Tetraodon nigroviridis]
MNASAANASGTAAFRDSFSKAVTKNAVVLVLGLFINYINRGLIHTFCKHQVFYTNSRYVLFIHLVINDMLHVNLTMVLFLISYTVYRVNVCVCWLLLLPALITTENTPLNLAAMALECYVAVCLPLRHAQICTVRRTRTLILLMWTTTVCSSASDLLLTLATERLAIVRSQVFCLRHTAFPHPVIVKKRDATYSLFLVMVWITMFYAYFRILVAAKTASKDAKKARNTIVLHSFQLLLCMAAYLTPALRDALQRRFPENSVDVLFASYVLVQILPRSLSPLVYSVRDQTFRRYLRRYLLRWRR